MNKTVLSPVPPLDLTRQYSTIETDISAAVLEVLASGQYINGPVVQSFSKEFGDYVGSQACVSCNSGTDALYLALRALNIGEGDEVITSPFTFIATAEAISAVGAKPVFIDIERGTFNLNPALIEAAITPRTKAIMPVHIFGKPVDMDAVMAVAEAHQLPVIEDCAQATGAEWQGKRVGSIGNIGCFSFFPTKNLGGCGDGGALTTDDPDIAAAATLIRDHGSKVRYHHEAIGINSRLDAVQAAILKIKLQHLETWNQNRERVAKRYQALLAPISGVVAPKVIANGRTVWNQYSILLEDFTAEKRDRLRATMKDQGVATMVYYPLPLHRQPVYETLGYEAGSLPVTDRAAEEVLALPMFPELSEAQQVQVIHALKDGLANL
ncbi:MAG: DegT/DnrJ/EryC1/StrS family aminotransferase [Cyanobacteria bacterium P01_D01_bin.105]